MNVLAENSNFFLYIFYVPSRQNNANKNNTYKRCISQTFGKCTFQVLFEDRLNISRLNVLDNFYATIIKHLLGDVY